jgi:pimeloyl-ACP methyl ester carboxylesterase
MEQIPFATVDAGGVTLAYHESGAGEPVIFIGGLASTMDTWSPPVIERLSQKFRVIVFDNRGTGYSGETGEPFSVPLFARDTAALMDALGISRAHILGHSMGASIAQELTLTFPEKVGRLVLVAGDCGGAEAVKMSADILARLKDRSGTIAEQIDRMFSLLFPRAWLDTHDPLQYCPEVYEKTAEAVVARQIDAFYSWTGSCSRLCGLRVPVLVMTGDSDEVVPLKNSRILAERIPGSEFMVFPGGGHGLMYQFPDRFCDEVIRFLDR